MGEGGGGEGKEERGGYLYLQQQSNFLAAILSTRPKGGEEVNMCALEHTPNILRVFTFWFDRESIIPGNLGFAISVCRLRERGRMSK